MGELVTGSVIMLSGPLHYLHRCSSAKSPQDGPAENRTWPLSYATTNMAPPQWGTAEFYCRPEVEFLDEIQTKVLRVFLLDIHSHLYRFAICFFKLTQPLTVSTVQLLFTVKEKGENIPPYLWIKKSMHAETASLRGLKIKPRNLNEIVRS